VGRVLVLVVAWTCAGLWDISHIVEHAREGHAVDRGVAAAASATASLSLAAGEGHTHTHPPDGQPVLGNGRESRFELPVIAPVVLTLVHVEPASAWVPDTVSFDSGRIATSVAQPRAPPLS